MRQEWGVSTVIMNKRGNPCPKCLPWVGKVLIDDVWSGESRKDGPYPLMSTAIAAGLYHPRCKMCIRDRIRTGSSELGFDSVLSSAFGSEMVPKQL